MTERGSFGVVLPPHQFFGNLSPSLGNTQSCRRDQARVGVHLREVRTLKNIEMEKMLPSRKMMSHFREGLVESTEGEMFAGATGSPR